jgi:hypothetical protein
VATHGLEVERRIRFQVSIKYKTELTTQKFHYFYIFLFLGHSSKEDSRKKVVKKTSGGGKNFRAVMSSIFLKFLKL